MNNQFLPDQDEFEQMAQEDREQEATSLWIVSYSDFMTILMIFFLMMFAHRVWTKNVVWEKQRQDQIRATQEVQEGVVQRFANLADVEVKAERINIHLPSALLFESGQMQLRGSAQKLLSQIVEPLKTFQGNIVVEGHTDDLPVGRTSRYRTNWELSVARAFSVIHFLSEQGVSPSKLSARGFGPYRPRVANTSKKNRTLNRRIELILLKSTKTNYEE